MLKDLHALLDNSVDPSLRTYLSLLRSTLLYFTEFLFNKSKARPSTSTKIVNRFIAVVRNHTCNVLEVCLYWECPMRVFFSASLFMGYYCFLVATVTNYPKFSSLRTEICFLTILRVRSPKTSFTEVQRCQQIWLPLEHLGRVRYLLLFSFQRLPASFSSFKAKSVVLPHLCLSVPLLLSSQGLSLISAAVITLDPPGKPSHLKILHHTSKVPFCHVR